MQRNLLHLGSGGAVNRRLVLSAIASTLCCPNAARALPARPNGGRRLHLVNLHTGERFDGPYRDASRPLPDAMAELSIFLRDFHVGATIEVDVGVVDFLAAVMEAVGAQSAGILSAYRTPETNARLARTTFGVAENSQHLYGRALDVHLGSRLTDAVEIARAMHRGGVGWYPTSHFLHIDTGPVRNWDLDTNGLDLLLGARQRRRNDDHGVDLRYTAELNRSGRLRPEMEHNSQLKPEMQRSGRSIAAFVRHPSYP